MKKKFGNIEITIDEKRIKKKIETAVEEKYQNNATVIPPNRLPYNPVNRFEQMGYKKIENSLFYRNPSEKK